LLAAGQNGSHPVASSIHSITFWLNTFIPRDISGATTIVRGGEYKGLTALSSPPCYLTDQRNFSNDLRAVSRMHSWIKVDLGGLEPVLTQRHRCDVLIECDPVSGEVIRKRQGSTSNMKFSLVVAEPSLLIRMDCKHSEPITPAAHGIGETEYKGTIEIVPAARIIDIDLMICLFPAAEGYAAIEDRPGLIVFRHAPPAGILTLGPPRGAKRRIRSHWDDANFSAGEP
jgi:hypothetical protein